MLWDALKLNQASVVACVGAGGKTSLIQSLAVQAGGRSWPGLVTATTKMFYSQVEGYELVLSHECFAGITAVVKAFQTGKTAAWFAGRDNEKVLGLPLAWLDSMAAEAPYARILIEADGARQCLLKAPAVHEPLIPACTAATVGVLNMNAIGRPLSETNTHRLKLVSNIINKQAGETIGWQDLALLAAHSQGIFQYAQGTKILLLSGAVATTDRLAARKFADCSELAGAGIARVAVTKGYGCTMRPIEVYEL